MTPIDKLFAEITYYLAADLVASLRANYEANVIAERIRHARAEARQAAERHLVVVREELSEPLGLTITEEQLADARVEDGEVPVPSVPRMWEDDG